MLASAKTMNVAMNQAIDNEMTTHDVEWWFAGDRVVDLRSWDKDFLAHEFDYGTRSTALRTRI